MKGTHAERLAPWALMLPALFIAVIFFGLPLVYMLRMSFNLKLDQRLYVEGFTFDHYVHLLTAPLFLGAIWTTLRLSIIAALATLVLGYAFALLAWLKPPRWRPLFIGLALLPLLISEIAIIFGWSLFFPRNGLLSYALVSSGLVQDKVSLMYTEFTAMVGLVYITLPFCFFILLSIFDAVDKRILEASSDLGARPLTTFYEVLLPLTKTGIIVAFAQSVIWAMGTYATPSALGPDALWTMGYLVQEQMQGKLNWPLASALALVLVVIVAAVLSATRQLMTKRTEMHV